MIHQVPSPTTKDKEKKTKKTLALKRKQSMNHQKRLCQMGENVYIIKWGNKWRKIELNFGANFLESSQRK